MKDYMTDRDYQIVSDIKLFIITSDCVPLISTKSSDGIYMKDNYHLDYYDDNLENYFQNNGKKFSPNLINKIFKQLNLVFKELLKKHFAHRDIKPNNILIKYSNEEKTNFDCVLTDYGVSRQYKEEKEKKEQEKEEDYFMETICGTGGFMAPEMKKYKYKNNCDLFSIGITIYNLYFGKLPYDDKYKKKLNNNFEIEEDRKLEDLIKKLIKENPDERITWEDYFNHPFFKQYEY